MGSKVTITHSSTSEVRVPIRKITEHTDVPERTLYRWKQTRPKMFDVLEVGTAMAMLKEENRS